MSIRVFVYFNLHRKCWSVKALEGVDKGRVIAHAEFVALRDAAGKVSEAGRQRVLREKRKNVHAGIVGVWNADVESVDGVLLYPHPITYNPYKHKTFVYKESGKEFKHAAYVTLSARDGASVTAYNSF